MTHTDPARTAARRTGSTGHGAGRRRVPLVAIPALHLASATFPAPRHPFRFNDTGRARLSGVTGPQPGQAALVLRRGRPAASPHDWPGPIASRAKVMTACLTLERYPLSGAPDRFTTLGFDHTIYTDPSGFDPGTVSTAADQPRVFQRTMRFPTFRQIVSMASVRLPVAGTVTNFNRLIAEGYAGRTASDSTADGFLAFFTRVPVRGRWRPAVGVVLGQGQGTNTSVILAAAGEAAQQLVDSVAPARRRTIVVPTAAGGGPGGDAGSPDRPQLSLPVSSRHRPDVTQSLQQEKR